MQVKRFPTTTRNLWDAIGDTPLLHLKNIDKGLPGKIFAKCEHLNPSGSIKDRMAIKMIEDAESAGKIIPGQHTLIDASAGNTAQALAMWGAIKGYKVKLYMGTAVGLPEKMRALERYGAEVDLIEIDAMDAEMIARGAGLQGARIEIPGNLKCFQEEEKDTDHIYWMRQGLNSSNSEGQAELGREILSQLKGKVDVFLASIGTGGTFLGVSQVLKATNPNTLCIAVEQELMEGVTDVLSPERKIIPGINDGITKQIVDKGFADDIIHLGNAEVRAMAYRLSREEGLYVGMSSGANVLAAAMIAQHEGMDGKNIVTVLVDRGDRNLNDERFIT